MSGENFSLSLSLSPPKPPFSAALGFPLFARCASVLALLATSTTKLKHYSLFYSTILALARSGHLSLSLSLSLL